MKTNQLRQKLEFASLLFAVAAVTVVWTCENSTAQAQETKTEQPKPASAQDLPSGEEVMASHIKMTGGLDAYEKIKNRVSDSTLEIVGAGITLDIKTYAARPNKLLMNLDSKVTGKIEKGCTGKEFWENTLTGGPVVHEGQEKAMGLRESTFERFVYWQKLYESAKCVGLTKVDDAECYEVVLTPKKMDDSDKSKPMSLFLDKKDYLIKKIETVLESEAGSIPVTAYPGDYKKVDGIMMAHKVRIEMLGQKRVATVKSVEHNVDLPEDQFDPPADVKKLIK